MTTTTFRDEYQNIGEEKEIYKIPKDINAVDFVKGKEKSIAEKLFSENKTIIKMNSEMISKRRYKRNMAKYLKRQGKHYAN